MTEFAKVFGKPLSSELAWEDDAEVDIAGASEVIAVGFQATKGVTGVVIGVIHGLARAYPRG